MGGDDVGDTCTPSVRTCTGCHSIPVETMHSAHQMAYRNQTSPRMPVMFVSMGDVMHTMDSKDPTHKQLAKVGQAITARHTIQAVVVISACWTTEKKHCVTTTPIPSTMHDHPAENMMDFEY